MTDTSSPQGFKTTTSIEVSSNAIDREPVSYVNFGVYKKNIRGRYQYRKLQFDFKTQTLWNVKGETEKEIKGFRYNDIRAIEKDPENPLSFHIFYRNTPPYHIYAQSRREAELMCETLENVISNNKVGMDTTCNLNIVQIKSGVAMLKNQPTVAGKLGVGWTKRWIELYKWQLLIKREDTNTKPMIVRSLYHVPIAKFSDKQEASAVGRGLQYYVVVMFEDERFTMRFDTLELRDEWFLAFLNASQEDRELINISKEVGKGKDDLNQLTKKELEIQEKTQGEVATLRAELAILDRQTKETNEERQKIQSEVHEIKESNKLVDAEIKKLSNIEIVTLEEKQKSVETSAKSLESGISENNTKKDQLEQEIVQAKAKIESLKQDIVNANQKVKEKQEELGKLGAQNKVVVDKKHEAESALTEVQTKLEQITVENTDKSAKLDAKKATIAAMEAEIEKILEETKEFNKQREATEQANEKLKEQHTSLTQQKTSLADSLQSLQGTAATGKAAYEEAVKLRDEAQRELQDKQDSKRAEALLNDLDNEDSDSEAEKEESTTSSTPAPTESSSSSSSSSTTSPPAPSETNAESHDVAWELPKDAKKEEEEKKEEDKKGEEATEQVEL